MREYVGKGLAGELAAAQDAEARAERAAAREELRHEQQMTTDLRASLAALSEQIVGLMEATLEARGYHEHRGEWRRKRR